MLYATISDVYVDIYKNMLQKDKKELFESMGFKPYYQDPDVASITINHSTVTLSIEFDGDFTIARVEVPLQEKIYTGIESSSRFGLVKLDSFLRSYNNIWNAESLERISYAKNKVFPYLKSFFNDYKHVIKLLPNGTNI